MANRFRLTSMLKDSDLIDFALKSYYQSWRKLNQHSNASFTKLDNAFFTNKILKDLEAGPLKLYLYFSHAANNEFGHSWHSISTIADYFDIQTRTIDNWIKVLVEKNLIYRTQKGHKSHNTYLIPFSDTLISHSAPSKRTKDDQGLLDDFLVKIKNLSFLYGEILQVYHLFQWTSPKGKKVTRDKSVQQLLIITKRKNGVLIGHLHTLKKSDHLSVSELEIEEPSIFQSPFLFNESNVTGLALTPNPPLKTKVAIRDTIDLVAELANIEEWELMDRQELNYGLKDELIPFEEEQNSEVDEDEDKGQEDHENTDS